MRMPTACCGFFTAVWTVGNPFCYFTVRYSNGFTSPNLTLSPPAVLLFDSDLKAADEAAPLDEVELDPGDSMWFSPKWYQTVSRACFCHTASS